MNKLIIFILLFYINLQANYNYESKYNIFSFGGGFAYTGYEKYILNIDSVYTYKYFSASINYKDMFEVNNDKILHKTFYMKQVFHVKLFYPKCKIFF